ncbi:nocturnin isoform X2 [Wyeomyia smithii]|nr:nocturnin isoform X2 [Wyeomyia smithii]XP_055550965.1 nocturnin isoform X2 [Wyeomyia smithii]XP_055550966.1 nocturnin isoform X2 [Wyeomyia smithii]XP_055550967.1 nocturnin isoform X2 [Wyeomyia smithii]
MFCGPSIMDLLVGGQFAGEQDKTGGQVSRMISEESFRTYNQRGSFRKDSSDADDLVLVSSRSEDGSPWYDTEEEVDLSQFENEKQTRDYFRKRIAIFEASMKTPVAANRRLAARKMEMEGGFGEAWEAENECIPPRQLLMYLVRMGSFTSAPQIKNVDYQDDQLEISNGMSIPDLLEYCRIARGEDRPQLVKRKFLRPNERTGQPDLTDGFRMLTLDAISKTCSKPTTNPAQLRIFQWNMLSQTLGMNNDGFVRCPVDALTWECRRYQVIQEIVQNDPDIVCLQEVDHFKFIQKILATQNYEGVFFPKPDSPCLYIHGNNGPDGCAVFFKKDRLELINHFTRVLEVWRVQSNQVAIAALFRTRDTNQEICVTTTHLKARKGALLSKLRNEQGKDLLYFIDGIAQKRPVILCGDFNAEPVEPIYSTVLNYKPLGLSSAYSDLLIEEPTKENNLNVSNKEHSGSALQYQASIGSNHSNDDDCSISSAGRTKAEQSAAYEPPYTTWKIREEGEVCHTIDYVFYSKDQMTVKNCLMFPSGEEISPDRTPSFQYPSDHFSLVCDFELQPAPSN